MSFLSIGSYAWICTTGFWYHGRVAEHHTGPLGRYVRLEGVTIVHDTGDYAAFLRSGVISAGIAISESVWIPLFVDFIADRPPAGSKVCGTGAVYEIISPFPHATIQILHAKPLKKRRAAHA